MFNPTTAQRKKIFDYIATMHGHKDLDNTMLASAKLLYMRLSDKEQIALIGQWEALQKCSDPLEYFRIVNLPLMDFYENQKKKMEEVSEYGKKIEEVEI